MHSSSTIQSSSENINTVSNNSLITRREKEVLNLIAFEHSSKEIAAKLYVSYETVNSHRKNIMDKLGVRNTAGLVRVAFERGLMRVGQVACLLIFVCSSIMSQNTYVVTSLSDDLDEGNNPLSGTLRWALASSNITFDGVDSIIFDDSFSSSDTIFLTQYVRSGVLLSVDRPVVINGNDVVIFPTVPGNIIHVNQASRIENLQFVNSVSDGIGGAMFCNTFGEAIELIGCTFKNNQSNATESQGRGGAILQIRGETIITNCHFENNTGTLGLGGAISTEGFHQAGDPNFKITIEGSSFVNNGSGGAVFIGCHTDLFLLDGDSEFVVLTQGCENFGLQSGSINMNRTFALPVTVPFTIDLQSLN